MEESMMVKVNREWDGAKKLSPCVQRELPGYVQICPHCKKEIPAHWVQQGGLHIDCYGTDIDVWFVSLPDDPKNGFYEADPEKVMDHLDAADYDEPYLIQKKEMTAGQYHNLSDFEGF